MKDFDEEVEYCELRKAELRRDCLSIAINLCAKNHQTFGDSLSLEVANKFANFVLGENDERTRN